MSETLLPCPFCGGEARFAHIFENPEKCMVSCRECDGGIDAVFANEGEAATAWNRRAQPANEPLTLDELREMDGEPVWVTHKDGSGGRWGIVNSYKGAGMCADLDSYTAYWFDDWCGTIAYRRKPEGSKSDGL